MGRQAVQDARNETVSPVEQAATVRLDPLSLPQTFKYKTGLTGEASDASVVLDRAAAVISRRLPSGLPTMTRLPVESFEGVAVRMATLDNEVMIVLHRDPMMSLPLMVTDTMDDVVADWRAWGRVLSLPLLMVEADGSFRPVETCIGAVRVLPVKPRRRRTILAKRRPRFLMRRRVGTKRDLPLHSGESEIISWQ